MPQFVLLLHPIRPIIRQRALFASRALWAVYGPSRTFATDNASPPNAPPSDRPPGGSSSSDGGGRLPGPQRRVRSGNLGVNKSVGVAVSGEATEGGQDAGYVNEVGMAYLPHGYVAWNLLM